MKLLTFAASITAFLANALQPRT